MKHIHSKLSDNLVLEEWLSDDNLTYIIHRDEYVHISIRNTIGDCTKCIYESYIKENHNSKISLEETFPSKIKCEHDYLYLFFIFVEMIKKDNLYYESK